MAKETFLGLTVPFLDLLGVKAEEIGGGKARISVEPRPELLNSFDVFHGGVIMSLLDVAMAVAARSSRNHAGGVMTVDMSVSFMRSASGSIMAEGRVLRGGQSLYFCEGEVLDENGELVAKSIGTFKLRREMHKGEGN
jgi:uncharacterized protein (TIGR00369 family)